jgi:hypothetical protein
MLHPDPAQEPRLLAIVVNLNDRLREAHEHGWLGEVDGLKVSLDAAHQKLAQMRRPVPARPTCPRPPSVPGDHAEQWPISGRLVRCDITTPIVHQRLYSHVCAEM